MTRSFPFLALGAFILLGTGLAQAQDLVSAQVKVPFTFHAGSAIRPAGEYDVRFDNALMPGVLRIRSVSGHAAAFVIGLATDVPKSSNDDPRLVFDKDGDTYVLTEVVDPGADRALLVVGAQKTREHGRAEAGAE
jgi:hypothetical protein